ncbi:MAG: STAS/SEC14 domain-containing protein [Azonexus sp.]|jgi:hypothetical protein|nr:STAS/SEC14 domain-containing protein [Azonexus sp.]
MIVVDHQANRVTVAVFGEFALADYREFEEMVNYTVHFEGTVDLLFDLSKMSGFTIDVAWEDLKFVRAHTRDFRRTALVTDNQWISWSAWISRVFADTELAVFPDREAATAWLDEEVAV